jgi:hypothetical protein
MVGLWGEGFGGFWIKVVWSYGFRVLSFQV